MLQSIIHRIFRRRHYWRQVTFEEVAELYASRLLMVFAINIVNLFAAIYLYKLGYSLVFIALFYAFVYFIKVPLAYPIAKFAAFFGPKHGILAANIIRLPSLLFFFFVPVWGFWAVIMFGVFQQISSAMYDMCYMIDFSKVKHIEHAGKEIGIMQGIERVARIASPVIGGFIASIYSPQVTIALAALLFLLAAWPLLLSLEPTATRNHLKFEGFPWRIAWPSFLAESVAGFDFVTSGLVWTLFITIFVFSWAGDGVYAIVGMLASIGVTAALVSSWTFGQLIDKHKGALMLTAGSIINIVNHIFRPFVSTITAVAGINIASEVGTAAYTMPYMRGAFDIADGSGHRIAYMMYVEMALNFGAALACIIFAILLISAGDKLGTQITFFVAAGYELLLLPMRRSIH